MQYVERVRASLSAVPSPEVTASVPTGQRLTETRKKKTAVCRVCGSANLPRVKGARVKGARGYAGRCSAVCETCCSVPLGTKSRQYFVYRATPEGRAGQLWSKAKVRARKKGLEFTLSRAPLIASLERGTCPITGLPFYFGLGDARAGRQRTTHPLSPSIDRIDSSRGYTDDNVRVVCWAINMGCSEWGFDVARYVWARALGFPSPAVPDAFLKGDVAS